jgi:capsular polysaccharide biosynthesis protein
MAARNIKVVSITELGAPCAVPEIGLGTASFAHARHGGEMLCAVRNAFLFGPYGFVVLPDGTLIQESVLKVDAARLNQNFDQFKAMFPGETVMWSHAEKPVLALNGYSTNNYFHFLIDNLSQLQWRADAPQLAPLPVILSGFPARAEARRPFIPAARDMLGLASAAFDGTMMFCKHIIFPARRMGATARRVETLRRLFAAQRSTAPAHRRLFLDRPVGERRQLINAGPVRALAARHGFEIVNPGALPLADQVRLFSEARMICGPHGAGFANAAFMPPGGAVLELTHAALIEPYFEDLAAAAGLSYRRVVGAPRGNLAVALEADLEVGLADMETALTEMSDAHKV